jgi:prepilin-type N-terminal cleavage/methylation domain-containing protein
MTLIEVVIALVIFAICVGGFCALVSQVRQAADMARDRYIAVNLAKNRLERARSFDFYQLHLFKESDVLLDQRGSPSTEGNFRRTTTVSYVTDIKCQLIVKVEVRNRITRAFEPKPETVSSYLAYYAEPTSS